MGRESGAVGRTGGAVLAVAAMLLAGAASPGPGGTAHARGAAAGGPGGRPGAPALLYVTNQDAATVSVIDVGTLEVLRTVRLQDYGFSANAKPHDVAVEPDGSAWYVSLIGDNKVVKFSADDRVLGQADVEVAGLIALHPGGELLYATRSMSAVNPPPRIAEIRRSDMDAEEIDVLFPRPHALSIQPSGAYVYTASLAVNQMAVIDVKTGEVRVVPFEGPNYVLGHSAISPDGKTLVVTMHTPELRVFDLSDPAAPRYVATIEVGELPWLPAFSPDGRQVYVPNRGDNTVSVVDIQRRQTVATVEGQGFAEPYAAIVSPDGRRVFVSNSNTQGTYIPEGAAAGSKPPGTVVVIDAATRAVTDVIPVGRGPTGMAIAGVR
ncbi:MAG TPA: hypothetical protein VF188_03980 [Longimicrobiales bacterium]